jgi:hypothetical protein
LGRLEDKPVGFVGLPGPLSSMLETATEEKERRVSSIAVSKYQVQYTMKLPRQTIPRLSSSKFLFHISGYNIR